LGVGNNDAVMAAAAAAAAEKPGFALPANVLPAAEETTSDIPTLAPFAPFIPFKRLVVPECLANLVQGQKLLTLLPRGHNPSLPDKHEAPEQVGNALSGESILPPIKKRSHPVTATKSIASRVQGSAVKKARVQEYESKSGSVDSSPIFPPISEGKKRAQADGLLPHQRKWLESFQTCGNYEVLHLSTTWSGRIGCTMKKAVGYFETGGYLKESLQIEDPVKSCCQVDGVCTGSLAETWGLQTGDIICLSPPSVGPWLDYEGIWERLEVQVRPVEMELYVIRFTGKRSLEPVGGAPTTREETELEQGVATDTSETVEHRDTLKVGASDLSGGSDLPEEPTTGKQRLDTGTLIDQGHVTTDMTSTWTTASQIQATGSCSPHTTDCLDSPRNLSASESSLSTVVANLRWLAKHYLESKANRDGGTKTCLPITELLDSNDEKTRIEASVTLACLTHQHEVNAATLQSLQGISYFLFNLCEPNASTRLQRASLSALFSLSLRKLCRSEILEYRGGAGIRGIVEAMRHPKQNRDLQKQGCRLLGRLIDCSEAKRVVAEQRGLVALAEIILKYPDDDEMQESALYAMNRFYLY
jgi:hypothetical protein